MPNPEMIESAGKVAKDILENPAVEKLAAEAFEALGGKALKQTVTKGDVVLHRLVQEVEHAPGELMKPVRAQAFDGTVTPSDKVSSHLGQGSEETVNEQGKFYFNERYFMDKSAADIRKLLGGTEHSTETNRTLMFRLFENPEKPSMIANWRAFGA